MLPVPDSQKLPEGLGARIMAALMTFFMALFVFFRSMVAFEENRKEEFRPLSPNPQFTEEEVLSTVWKQLGELEGKVSSLRAKPYEMPYEKERLLNVAVCRVDALEAELIATKKALYEALMRQEDLLAYIDRQEAAKHRKKKFRW